MLVLQLLLLILPGFCCCFVFIILLKWWGRSVGRLVGWSFRRCLCFVCTLAALYRFCCWSDVRWLVGRLLPRFGGYILGVGLLLLFQRLSLWLWIWSVPSTVIFIFCCFQFFVVFFCYFNITFAPEQGNCCCCNGNDYVWLFCFASQIEHTGA